MSDTPTPDPENSAQNNEQADENSHEKTLSDILHHVSEAASIASALGEEKIGKIFGDVGQKFEKVSSKGQQAAQKAKERMSGQKASMEEKLGELVDAALARLRVATKDDIERLEKLILDLKQDLQAPGDPEPCGEGEAEA